MSSATTERRNFLQVGPGIYVDPVERADIKPGNRMWILLNDAGMASLGLTPAQYDTVFRLGEAGFIIISNWAPRLWVLDRGSWDAHLARTAEDPFFWDNRERMRKYRATYKG